MSADKSGCLHMHTHIHSASIVPPTWRHAQQDKQMTSNCAAKQKSKKNTDFAKTRKQTAKLWIIVLGVSFTPVSLIFFPFFFSFHAFWSEKFALTSVNSSHPFRAECTVALQYGSFLELIFFLHSLFQFCIVSVEDWMFNIFENFIFVVKLTLFGVTFLAQSHTTRLLSQQRDCCFHICLAVSRFDFASQSWWAVAAHTILLCFLFFFFRFVKSSAKCSGRLVLALMRCICLQRFVPPPTTWPPFLS